MILTPHERYQTRAALARCGWSCGEYDERDIGAGRERERQLIAEAEREAERAHSARITRLIDIEAGRVIEYAAWRARVRERIR